VHTDVSYTLHDHRFFTPLQKLINGPLGDRVLFGTDYFMTTREKPESTLVGEFRDSLKANPRHWKKISQDNVARWLSSKHYRF
jgi:predicted TIM-barrel fold metal-dependent hydrolase